MQEWPTHSLTARDIVMVPYLTQASDVGYFA